MPRVLVASALGVLVVMLALFPGRASPPGPGAAPALSDGSQALPNNGSTTSADPMAELPADSATAVAVSRMTCSYKEAKAIVEAFLDAFNRGDQAALAQFFGPRFKWWSATHPDEPHSVAYRPDAALRYLVRRHGDRERLTTHAPRVPSL